MIENAQQKHTPIVFQGKTSEYFGIWIVNILLSLVTIGIYSAWAKVRREKYFYNNTLIENVGFDYHAKPISILKGRIIALVFFEHELEADGFALNALQKACLPPKAFADILKRLQNQALGDGKKDTLDKTAKTTLPHQDDDFVSEMLATHPDTQARIKPFLAAKQNCN
jgi:predicted Zn-dependent protease